MKKQIKAHEERNVKSSAPNEPSNTPLPQYLLDRSNPTNAKALSSSSTSDICWFFEGLADHYQLKTSGKRRRPSSTCRYQRSGVSLRRRCSRLSRPERRLRRRVRQYCILEAETTANESSGWKRMITKPTFVGPDFTRRPVKYERFIRPMGLRYKKANVTVSRLFPPNVYCTNNQSSTRNLA